MSLRREKKKLAKFKNELDSPKLEIQERFQYLFCLVVQKEEELRWCGFSNKGYKEENELDWILHSKFVECGDD